MRLSLVFAGVLGLAAAGVISRQELSVEDGLPANFADIIDGASDLEVPASAITDDPLNLDVASLDKRSDDAFDPYACSTCLLPWLLDGLKGPLDCFKENCLGEGSVFKDDTGTVSGHHNVSLAVQQIIEHFPDMDAEAKKISPPKDDPKRMCSACIMVCMPSMTACRYCDPYCNKFADLQLVDGAADLTIGVVLDTAAKQAALSDDNSVPVPSPEMDAMKCAACWFQCSLSSEGNCAECGCEIGSVSPVEPADVAAFEPVQIAINTQLEVLLPALPYDSVEAMPDMAIQAIECFWCYTICLGGPLMTCLACKTCKH